MDVFPTFPPLFDFDEQRRSYRRDASPPAEPPQVIYEKPGESMEFTEVRQNADGTALEYRTCRFYFGGAGGCVEDYPPADEYPPDYTVG